MRNGRWFAALVLGLLAAARLPAGEPAPVQFQEHLVAGGYSYAFGLAAADLDGDGDLDLTSQDAGGKPTLSSLFWFENDGRGAFARRTIHTGEPGWFERHAVGDLSGDGRPDVAIVNNRDGHLLWFENNPRPAEGPWQRYVISTTCTRAYDVALADLDGDGDLDAAAAGYASNRILWYENPGPGGWQSAWTERLIGQGMSEARLVRAGDFNRDGRIDILAAAVGAENVPADAADPAEHGSCLAWFENPGNPATEAWPKHVIDNQSRAPIHGEPADLDGDGDLDVVIARGMRRELVPEERHEIAWHENPGEAGAGSAWRKHGIGFLPFAFEAAAADLDGDGDLDVAATAWSLGDRLVWFENRQNAAQGWRRHTLKEGWKAANMLIVADLNGDGRPDLAATADNGSARIGYQGANELRWWANAGGR